jgi:hypothetical protein
MKLKGAKLLDLIFKELLLEMSKMTTLINIFLINLSNKYSSLKVRFFLIKGYAYSFIIISSALVVVFMIFNLKSNMMDDPNISIEIKSYLPSMLNFV